jgi:hypothetical protein
MNAAEAREHELAYQRALSRVTLSDRNECALEAIAVYLANHQFSSSTFVVAIDDGHGKPGEQIALHAQASVMQFGTLDTARRIVERALTAHHHDDRRPRLFVVQPRKNYRSSERFMGRPLLFSIEPQDLVV